MAYYRTKTDSPNAVELDVRQARLGFQFRHHHCADNAYVILNHCIHLCDFSQAVPASLIIEVDCGFTNVIPNFLPPNIPIPAFVGKVRDNCFLGIKMLFVKYPELLKRLVEELLGIKYEDTEQFNIRNPEIPPEAMGDKFCRLDINMILNGQRIDLEIQVEDEGNYPERSF